MAVTRRARSLTLGHQQQLDLLRQQQAARIARIWETVGDISDETQFIRLAQPVLRAGRLTSARFTTAYLNAYQSLEAGGRTMIVLTPEQLEQIATGIRSEAAIEEILRRPTVAARSSLSKGSLWQDAMSAGRALAENIARTDVSLVERATMSFLSGRLRPRGWVRIVESKPCSFCARAAGQIVSKPSIAPMHPNCHCTLEPIYSDVTRQIPVRKPKAQDDFSFDVETHGEYGPTAVRQPDSQE